MPGDQDDDLVADVLRELDEAAERLSAMLADADGTTFTVDMGDIQAVANAEGRLVDLTLHPRVTTDYTHTELAARINTAFAALREAVEADFRTRYGALHAAHLGGYAKLNRIQRLYRYLPEPVLRRLVTRGVGQPTRGDGEVAFRSLRYLDVLRPEQLPALP